MRGLLVIGHGSRRAEANATVRELAERLVTAADQPRAWGAVQPAFLELEQPDIAAGYGALAEAGCTEIVAYPFFLFDGNHTRRDIPAALDQARTRHPTTRWILSEPLGLHDHVIDAVRARLDDTLRGMVSNETSSSAEMLGTADSGIGPEPMPRSVCARRNL